VVRALSARLAPLDAERERRRVGDLLEALPEAILLVDEDERVYYANGRVREAYGVEPARMVGRSLADVLTEPGLLLGLDDPEAFLDATLRLLDTDDEPYEDIFRRTDGSAFVRRSLPARGDGRLIVTTNVTRVRQRNQEVEEAHMRGLDALALRVAQIAGTHGPSRFRLLQGGRTD
jgi:PAS domain S-box-containing protein